MQANILIVDDEESVAELLSRLLRREGYEVDTAGTAAQARRQLDSLWPDLVLMDLQLPDGDGSELLAEFAPRQPDVQFLVVTGHGSIRSAVEATRRGAVDYFTKPVDPQVLLFAIRKALSERARRDETDRLRSRCLPVGVAPSEAAEFPSRAMRETLAAARRLADQDGIVLLLGESGTGKDHLARWIHARSQRAAEPFFDINCAALSAELAESELFGHEPGAFTGSRGRKRGLLELAHGGTLLLNEVGELTPGLQAKLLTFLDSRTFLRVGGERRVTVDARIFAATGRDLAREVAAGRFRADLFYRLNVLPLRVPPLRERTEDLAILAGQILRRLREDMGLPEVPRLESDALAALRLHDWPGNVRELRNVLERAVILSADGTLRRRDLVAPDRPLDAEWSLTVRLQPGVSLHETTRHVARELVAEACRRATSLAAAAESLGLSRHALAHQLRTLGLTECVARRGASGGVRSTPPGSRRPARGGE